VDAASSIPLRSGPAVYRPREPRAAPLYRLLDTRFEAVRGEWEERFESHFGFWRGCVDGVVARYLDCGILENGFARVRCTECRKDMLVAFSCKSRGLCPSCGAKRAAETANRLREDVLEWVGHAQWVFTVPKMLRLYFLRHRELLGDLCRAAWQTVREMIVAGAGEQIRPGMVAVIQTFGSTINFHPHVHAIVSRGGWTEGGQWVPVPWVDRHAAELLFRHKVLTLLRMPDDHRRPAGAPRGRDHVLRVQRFVDELVALPDRKIFDAMIWIMERCKLVVEGAAAAPVAALLNGLVKLRPGSRVAVVLSGGNVNLDPLRSLNWN